VNRKNLNFEPLMQRNAPYFQVDLRILLALRSMDNLYIPGKQYDYFAITTGGSESEYIKIPVDPEFEIRKN